MKDKILENNIIKALYCEFFRLKKQYITSLIVLMAIVLLSYVRYLNSGYISLAFATTVAYFLCLFSPLILYRNLYTKERELDLFMLPISRKEKFFTIFLQSVVLYPLVLSLFLSIAFFDISEVVAIFTNGHTSCSSQTLWIDIVLLNSSVISSFAILFIPQSIVFMYVILFRKNRILYMALTFIGFFALLIIAASPFVYMVYKGYITDDVNISIESFPRIGVYLDAIFIYLTPFVFYIISYFCFKRKEIR